jgi:hypothetical protein
VCVCGWDLVVIEVVFTGLLLVYGEINRRSAINDSNRSTEGPSREPRHRDGESVTALRERHGADTLPYYPNPTSHNGS